MHMWYNSTRGFVNKWKGSGITKDLQKNIRRAEKWLQKTGRHLPPPVEFNLNPPSAPPASMVRALNRVVVVKTSQSQSDDPNYFEHVQAFFSNLDPFPAAYSTEQQWFDFFVGKWDSSQ